RSGHARRLRQRAGRDVCGTDRRADPGALGLLSRRDLQGRRGVRPVCRAALAAPAGPSGESLTMGRDRPYGWIALALVFALYPLVFSGAFARDVGVQLLLWAIAASA